MKNKKPYHTIGEWTVLTEWFTKPAVDSTNFDDVDSKDNRPDANPVSRAPVKTAGTKQPR
jgi:hypothetical protein